MKIFEAPEMSIQVFAVEDVITTSTGNSSGAGADVGGGLDEED